VSIAQIHEEVERLDVAVYAAIARTPTPILDRLMRRVTSAADYSKLSLGAAAVLAVAGGRTGRRAAKFGLASVAATGAVVNVVVKPLRRRVRPDREVHEVPSDRHAPMPISHSFPSGHSAAAFAFATGVAHVSHLAAVPLYGMGTVVAYSRVHTGVHYPGDVIAGSLLGVVLAQATANLTDRMLTRQGRD
jgi:membrane-associated phospholipid phosphatase